MAGFIWILTLLCVAGCHQASASPVLRSPWMVQVGQNVTLTCNLTSSREITWYLFGSDQLLPLLTVQQTKFGQETVNFHSANSSRISTGGNVETGLVSLEILEVEEKDAGLYFCSGRCGGDVCVNRGTLLDVNGVDGGSARDKMKQPCWNLGICVLPAFLVLVFAFTFGFYMCSGKSAVCCCCSERGDSSLKFTQEESLHYSSLKHANQPRPSDQGPTGLDKEDVTYSTVATRKNPNRSHEHR